jgi:hypothetical protein
MHEDSDCLLWLDRPRFLVAAHLRDLYVLDEAQGEVLEHDAVRGREECEDVLDEVALVVAELLPVLGIITQVDLLGCAAWEATRDSSGGRSARPC